MILFYTFIISRDTQETFVVLVLYMILCTRLYYKKLYYWYSYFVRL